MVFNPITGLDEDEELVPQDPTAAPQSTIQNPTVREYLLKRKGERDALEKDNDGYDIAGVVAGGLASLGAAFQGGNSVAAANQVMDQRAKRRKDKISDFDSGTDRYLKDVDAGNSADKMDRDNASLKRESDPNSQESKMADELARQMGYKGGPISATQFKSFSPVMQKKYEIEQKKIENDLARTDKRMLREMALDDKKRKDSELSATQAKQLGTYNTGATAEDQYNQSVANPNDYDPTQVGQIIDNSSWAPNWMKNDSAIKAQNAQSAWVEAFLRDASGAAIAPSERMNYAKDFFPQSGDPKDVVANKAALRKQKMQNALLGAGEQGKQIMARGDTQASPTKSPQQLAMEEIERRKRAKQTAGR